MDHPYIDVLRAMWRGDVAELAAEIQSLARLAGSGSAERGEIGRESRARSRSAIGSIIMCKRRRMIVSTEAIIRVLDSAATSPSDEIRRQYIKKLLHNALSERDAAAGKRVAEELEKDASLEGALSEIFDEMLEDQPDAVYVFIRNRLMRLGVDEAWIPRLQAAARSSLEVAIEEGDVGTLAGWLELIAHEPQTYQLHDILQASHPAGQAARLCRRRARHSPDSDRGSPRARNRRCALPRRKADQRS